MSNGAVSIEKSMAVPQKQLENYHTVQQFPSGYTPKGINNRIWKRYLNIYANSSIIHNGQKMKQPKCLWKDEWIIQMW